MVGQQSWKVAVSCWKHTVLSHHCTNPLSIKQGFQLLSSAHDMNYLKLQRCSNLNLAILFKKTMRNNKSPSEKL